LSPFVVGIISICGFLLLMALGLPIAFCFAVTGFAGVALIAGLQPALSLLGSAPYSFASSEYLLPLPLFVLMGFFAFHSGIATDLFGAASKWLGRVPGGLAQATTLACTGFAACTGDSSGAAATMGTISFPSMERFGYSRGFASACIAAGGTIGILIPPSIPFIVYGFLTQTSIADLFVAGIFPGLLCSALIMTMIAIFCKRNPELGPPGKSYPWREMLAALKGVWGMMVLFVLIIGGLYIGIFSPSEAGAIGAFGAFIIALSRRRITRATIIDALTSSLQITCFIFTIIIGAMIFNTLLSISGMSALLTKWIGTLPVSPHVVLVIVFFIYFVLGMFMDPLAMTLLTIPTFAPILVNLGFDAVWFGVLFVLLNEIALITPPVGMNVFVVQGVTKVPLGDIFRHIIPFVIAMVLSVVLLVIFPQISLFLPYSMR
jgi:C4-dicarboxylate transporter DctM subunit